MYTDYILAQECCNFGHVFGQGICESNGSFFPDTFCLLYSFFFCVWRVIVVIKYENNQSALDRPLISNFFLKQ